MEEHCWPIAKVPWKGGGDIDGLLHMVLYVPVRPGGAQYGSASLAGLFAERRSPLGLGVDMGCARSVLPSTKP